MSKVADVYSGSHKVGEIHRDHEAELTDAAVNGLPYLILFALGLMFLPLVILIYLLYKMFKYPRQAGALVLAIIIMVGPPLLYQLYVETRPSPAVHYPSTISNMTTAQTSQPSSVQTDQQPLTKPASQVAPSTVMHVKAVELNMRSGPGAKHQLITGLRKDSKVTLLGETVLAQDGGRWVKVRVDQYEGWVNKKHLK